MTDETMSMMALAPFLKTALDKGVITVRTKIISETRYRTVRRIFTDLIKVKLQELIQENSYLGYKFTGSDRRMFIRFNNVHRNCNHRNWNNRHQLCPETAELDRELEACSANNSIYVYYRDIQIDFGYYSDCEIDIPDLYELYKGVVIGCKLITKFNQSLYE